MHGDCCHVECCRIETFEFMSVHVLWGEQVRVVKGLHFRGTS